MTVTLALRFPLGRYHATPWNQAVNEGAVEWPPSPWRLLRALVATRHIRWPDLSLADLDRILSQLVAAPPRYWTPPVSPGQTRHYMPDLAHQSGVHSTDLVLDPFLWVEDASPLLVQWDADLDAEQRSILTKLCELCPYVGRSESIVQMELLADDPVATNAWWEVSPWAAGPVSLLSPTAEAGRSDLEVTTSEVRRRRLTQPPSTHYLPYAREAEPGQPRPHLEAPTVEAIRWKLITKAPFHERYGVLATHELRRTRLYAVSRLDEAPEALTGKRTPSAGSGGALGDDHRHAHWLWLSSAGSVADLVLWVPDGISSAVAGSMVSRSAFPGFPGWNPEGFRPGEVHMIAAGSIASVARELTGPAVEWTCRTPYLPVRHRKRTQTVEDWVRQDIAKECAYRKLPQPVSVMVEPGEANHVRHHRRYRWSENMAERRAGVWVSLTFGAAVDGPVCLGQLSHFGFGLFVPTPM